MALVHDHVIVQPQTRQVVLHNCQSRKERNTPSPLPPTMIWSLTRWTLLIFHVTDHKLSFCRFCKSPDSPSPKNWKSSRRIYCQFISYLRITHYCKYMQQITRSKVHLTAAFQIADSLTAPRLEFTYAYEYFLPAGRRKRSLRICFVHKR